MPQPKAGAIPRYMLIETAQPLDDIPRRGEITDPEIEGIGYEPRVGRPTDYQANYMPRVAFSMTLLGATVPEIAEAFAVCPATIATWKNIHPEFLEACKRGGIVADARVAQSLYKRATGFKYASVKIFHNKDDGTVYAPYEEYVIPDPGAAMRWLNVRRGWTERKELVADITPSVALTELQERLAEQVTRLLTVEASRDDYADLTERHDRDGVAVEAVHSVRNQNYWDDL
jgi:hypothetical protein